MYKLTTSGLVLIMFFGLVSQTAFAKTKREKGDWSKVTAQVNEVIAVKTNSGTISFGKLTSANETEITVQLADKKRLTGGSSTFQRKDIKKIWKAELADGKGLSKPVSAALGAGLGAGAGLGLGFGLLAATGGSDSGGPIVLGIIAAGAGLGALAGYFSGKKGHKKNELIYEV